MFGDDLFTDQIEMSKFGRRITDLLEFIPRTNLHLIALENLARHPREELTSLGRFLGVTETSTAVQDFAHLNKNENKGAFLNLCQNVSLLRRVADVVTDEFYSQFLEELAKNARAVPSSYILKRPERCSGLLSEAQ